MYNSLAAPHLEYYSTLLYNLPDYIINKLQIIQNKTIEEMLEKLCIL